MKEYNEIMRISWENGEEKWGFTPRQDEGEIEKLRQQNAELLEALRSIAYHRKGGPTNNRLAVQLERLAIDAIAKATGEE